jgi:starvation-inducible outer membrane lipoprotein
MFVCEEEIVFCTSDLNAYKEHIHPHDIGQISTGDQVSIRETPYNIDSIQIEHYSWPMDGHVLNQTGNLYPYTINITFNLSHLYNEWN